MTATSIYDKSIDIVRDALPRMSRLKIPITPANYAVWYEYLSNTNQELRQEMDALLGREQPIGNDEMQALYERYLEERSEKLREAKTALGQVVATLMQHIEQADGKYNSVSVELGEIATNLAEETTAEDLDSLMDRAVRVTKAALEHGAKLKGRLSSLAEEIEEVRGTLARTQKEARTDALTGLDNRMVFQEALAGLASVAEEDSHAPCLLLVDIDFFKRVNDTHGHLAGDQVLKQVAQEIKASLRGRDVVARYGGEEFAVLLRDTPRTGCHAVADNLRAGIEASTIDRPDGEALSVTVSIGGAWFRQQEPPESLVERSDRALYASKQGGRNRVSWET